jgi:hypothetical protein
MEKKGIPHKPAYFVEDVNTADPGVVYYKYNGLYFEKDRLEGNWSRLPDLYNEQYPEDFDEVMETKHIKNKSKK